MSKNLSEINKSTENYFPTTNNVILTNLYFGSDELIMLHQAEKNFILKFQVL